MRSVRQACASLQCFNGAAPVRARKWQNSFTLNCTINKLQRGRACEGAEIVRVGSPVSATFWLQRGRACEGAEIRGSGGGKESFNLSFNGAAPVRARKSGRLVRRRPCQPGFNGAAPVRARKLLYFRPEVSAGCRLQRGRACEGAEITRERLTRLPPHSFNGAAPVRARKSGGGSPPIRDRVELQRGRACEGAEIIRTNCELGCKVIASTGPRL